MGGYIVEKQLSCKKIIFTLLGFVMFWAVVTDAWGYSDWIFRNNPNNNGTYFYGYFSRCIWAVPAILLIIKYNNQLKFQKDKLYKHLKFDKSLLIVISISLGYAVVVMLINHRGIWFNSENILGLTVVKYIVVGFVEETVFRGWGYNSLLVQSTIFRKRHSPQNSASSCPESAAIPCEFIIKRIRIKKFRVVPLRSVFEAPADKKSSVGFQIHKFQFLNNRVSADKDPCFPKLRPLHSTL